MMAESTNDISRRGSAAVFNYLKLDDATKNHTLIAVPDRGEFFSSNGLEDILEVYPKLAYDGSLKAIRGLLDFAKEIQGYGCDIIESWIDDQGKRRIIWHEVKTDNQTLDSGSVSNKATTKQLWRLVRVYLSGADTLRGTGNAFIELIQSNKREDDSIYYTEGSFSKYKRFVNDVNNSLRPDEHYIWQVMLVYGKDENGKNPNEPSVYGGYPAIKVPMDEFIDIAEKNAEEIKYGEFKGNKKLPMVKLWWVDDETKLWWVDENIKVYVDENGNAVPIPKFPIKSDIGNSMLYDLTACVWDGGYMDIKDAPALLDEKLNKALKQL